MKKPVVPEMPVSAYKKKTKNPQTKAYSFEPKHQERKNFKREKSKMQYYSQLFKRVNTLVYKYNKTCLALVC